MVSIAFTREMGPLFTGIVLASRIGAAFTAELGAMVAGGEVDALEAMGIGPLRYLITPRWLAIFSMTPCLSVVATLAGICGGAFISNLLLQLGFSYFFDQVMSNLLVKDILAGVFKSFVFGAIIGLVSCYKGLAVKGGAVGVALPPPRAWSPRSVASSRAIRSSTFSSSFFSHERQTSSRDARHQAPVR